MKKIIDFIPAHFLGLYVLGTLSQYYFHVLSDFYIGVAILVISLLFFRFYLKKGLILVAVCIGMLSMLLHKQDIQELQKGNNFYRFTISEVLKPNSRNNRFYVKNVFFEGEKYSKKSLVSVPLEEAVLEVGDEVVAYTALKEIASPKNPFDFDYKGFLKKKNITSQLYLKTGCFEIISSNENHPVRIANYIRSKLSKQLRTKIFSDNVRSVTEAMILGKRTNMSSELLQDFADAGAIHILAVSGLHVGILLLLLSFILKPLEYFKYGKQLKLLLLISALWLFALLAGLSPSVIRAVTMFSFVAVGMFLNRKNSVYHSIISSALLLLLFDPFYIFDVGFQMSYLAVFFIVWVQPMLFSIWSPKYKFVIYFWKLITVSITAQIGVLPISLFYFHQFPALFLLTNMVIIPAVGFVLVYGMVVLILSFWENAPKVIFTFYTDVLEVFVGFVNWVAQFEEFIFKDISFSKLKMWVVYLLLFLLFFFIEQKTIQKLKMVLIFVIIFQITFFYERYEGRNKSELIICNEYKTSLFVKNNKGNITFYSNETLVDSRNVSNYLGNVNVKRDVVTDSIPEVFLFQKELFFVVNKNTIYNIDEFNPTVVCLQNSPKINLERLLLKLKPQKIIADGSNYFYLKEKWKATCVKQNIEFYDTYVNGAYVIK